MLRTSTCALKRNQDVKQPVSAIGACAGEPGVCKRSIERPIFAPLRSRVEAGSVKAILTTAIRLDGRPIGILSLHHCEHSHTWTQWEADLVKSVADQAAVAIRQAELYREVRELAKRASLVNEIVGSIRGSLDLKEILQVAVEEVGRALGANRTYFRKLSGRDNVIVAEYLTDPSLSLSHVMSSFDDYITNYLIENRRTLVIDDVRSFAAAYPSLASTVRIWQVEPVNRSQIVCPIFVNGSYWGGLSVDKQTGFANGLRAKSRSSRWSRPRLKSR